MSEFKEKKVRIEVQSSECIHYKHGDKITIDGPLLDFERSDKVCVTALLAIYPFIFALRKGVSPEALGFKDKVLVQCPDNCAPVVFKLDQFTE